MLRLFVLGLFLLVSVSAEATTAGKKTVGTVKSLSQGDVACYVDLVDENNQGFSEMADFDICGLESKIKGKKVKLTYTAQNVMADSCQGNPECKDSKTVQLITSVTLMNGSKP